jgi:hypothetical protein
VAGSVVSLQEPYATDRLDQAAAAGTVELQPFEQGRWSLLAAPLAVAPGLHVVLELFDKQGAEGTAFTAQDRSLVAAATEFGAEILRHALAERQTQQMLLDAVAAALTASDSVAETLRGGVHRLEEPPPPEVMESLREGLGATAGTGVAAEDTLQLAEAVRVLALRHGPAAVQHCIRQVESLRALLDTVTGEAGRD